MDVGICLHIQTERSNEQMNDHSGKVIIGQMCFREKHVWMPAKKTKRISKRLLRNTGIFAAVSLCIGTGTYILTNHSHESQSVMSHLTAGFQYDETLGRLQFVSNILPASAMVFLNSDPDAEILLPTSAKQIHAWSSTEPWIEYECSGSIAACNAGEIITVVKNRQNEYTVRVLHENGYESVYSGLNTVDVREFDIIESGQKIGTSSGIAGFELRKEGLSVLPVFSAQ